MLLARLALKLSQIVENKGVLAIGRWAPTHVSLLSDRVVKLVILVFCKLLSRQYLSSVFVRKLLFTVRTNQWELPRRDLGVQVLFHTNLVIEMLALFQQMYAHIGIKLLVTDLAQQGISFILLLLQLTN